jgi:TRAP-type C4-dicarboxylate transport system permease small subunit
MLSLIDRISDKLGALASMTFFLIGLMITFEVVARYVFTAPTTWAEEGARLLQLWATYLAMGFVLKNQSLIRITALTGRFSLKYQRLLDVVALVWIIVFSLYAFWQGIEIVVESIEVGRATATMNQVPKFWTESAIPIGFLVLILQALAEIWRLLRGTPPGDPGRVQEQHFNEFGP